MSSEPRNYRHDILRHGICVTTSCTNSTRDIEGVSIATVIEECYIRKFYSSGLTGNITNLKCDTNENDKSVDFFDIIIG